MAAHFFDGFPAAVDAMAARCKPFFALHPGLSVENSDRTKEITNGRTKKRKVLTLTPLLPVP
jgi:hypothetical protein